jgi:CRISPR system Cascade subunit CasB
LRRVLPLVDSAINLPALAADVWHWGDPVRKRWVYDYRWPAKQST